MWTLLLMTSPTPNDGECCQKYHHQYHQHKKNSMMRNFFKYLQILILFQMITIINCSYDMSPKTPIKAAIKTMHVVGYQNVKLPPPQQYSPNLIEVKSSVPSFTIKFNSASSKVNLMHQHQSSKAPETKESFSEDEPHILRHQVVKPIVQEVHEIISPIRKIVQEIKPVQEDVNTIVSRSTSGGDGIGLTPAAIAQIFESGRTTPIHPTAAPVINQAITIDHTQPAPLQPIKSQSLSMKEIGLIQKALIEDLEAVLANKMPDLLIRKETELYDNSLYNGSNEYDLKYPSFNSEDTNNANSVIKTAGHDYPLYYD